MTSVTDMGILFAIPILFSLALAIPPAIREHSWKRFLGALLLSLFGIVLPVLIYLGTAALAPDSKEGCNYNWLHCFQVGKIALIPLVLWACAAFYASQVNKRESSHRAWVILGVLTGAVIGDACLVLSIPLVRVHAPLDLILLIPFYIPAWYSVLAARMLKSSELGIRSYAMTLLGSLPFWVGSMIWSRQYYLSLPEFQTKCFVVTAALGGHQALVGPFTQIQRNGTTRIANRQLLTFWQFEKI